VSTNLARGGGSAANGCGAFRASYPKVQEMVSVLNSLSALEEMRGLRETATGAVFISRKMIKIDR
jgi:hypothetical protein